jgi:branched-chain amino acid transport system permease protein
VLTELKQSLIASIWFSVLTFPLIVLKVDHVDKTIDWRWSNLVGMAIGSFIVSYFWRYLLKKTQGSRQKDLPEKSQEQKQESKKVDPLGFFYRITRSKPLIISLAVALILFPLLVSNYQTGILITAMMYIILGLGLNIVVGMAGLLDLGYVAFYATGAYTYALLNVNFGLGFWVCLPLAGIFAATMGVLLGIPVLRLRGDYLAIVTLGFGEIIRLILENWDKVTHGPSGIPNIPKPGLFGIDLGFQASTTYLYYITGIFMVFSIIVIRRLHISRIGRAWLALREDEIACQAMGVDKTKTKLTAFALGAFWAGFVGVIFAAKGSFVNPASFTFFESAIVLSIVVLGGMGSIRGVILATIVLILLPEYLRFFQEYRILTFGAIMVIMMVFRPQGLISDVQHKYELIDNGTPNIKGEGSPVPMA